MEAKMANVGFVWRTLLTHAEERFVRLRPQEPGLESDLAASIAMRNRVANVGLGLTLTLRIHPRGQPPTAAALLISRDFIDSALY